MHRFRFTIVAVCLLLAWLAYGELILALSNRTPQEITLDQLQRSGPPREWLTITGGHQDLTRAINMSGTMDIDSFLVPLTTTKGEKAPEVWFETRDPKVLATLKKYYFQFDTEQEKQAFVAANADLFYGPKTLTGMTVSGLVAGSNRDKLSKLLEDMDVPVSPRVVFISEGKKPVLWRGLVFAIIAILGIFKLSRSIKQERSA